MPSYNYEQNIHILLLPGGCYHDFNWAVGNEKLFLNNKNYEYFLLKLQQHILPVAYIITYALLPNHFHLLVKINPEDILIDYYETRKKKQFSPLYNSLPDFVMEQFSNWLNGYTKAFNKRFNRKGGLFIDYLKRNEVLTDNDATSVIFYIHKNAVHHDYAEKIGQWPFDSYNLILNETKTLLYRTFIDSLFNSKDSFKQLHSKPSILSKCARSFAQLAGNLHQTSKRSAT